MTNPYNDMTRLVAEQSCFGADAVSKRVESVEILCPELVRAFQKKIDEANALREKVAALEQNIKDLTMEMARKDAVIERLEANERRVWEDRIEMSHEFKTLRHFQAEAAPMMKKKCISLNVLLYRISAVMNKLGSKTEESINDLFEKGFDSNWLDEFWQAMYSHPDWVIWLTDESSLKYKNFLMIIGKLMSLKVFKQDTTKLSRCFDFPIQERSKTHYISDGASSLAERQPEMNTWIEEYVATNLAS